MPLRLIGVILVVTLLVTFIGLNLENVTDIAFGFYTFRDIPVFLTILASFALGLLAALPAVLVHRSKDPKARSEGRASRKPGRTAALPAEAPISGRRSSASRRSRVSDLEDGSYGVD